MMDAPLAYSKASDSRNPGVVPRMNYSGTFSPQNARPKFEAHRIASFIYKGHSE